MRRVLVNLLPLAVWPLYFICMVYFWSILAVRNPVFDWAIATLLPHGELIFHSFLHAHDLALNLVLVLPVALVLRFYAGAPSMLSIVTASLIVFIWQYWNILLGFPEEFALFRHPGAIVGAVVQLGLFPFAYWLAAKLSMRRAAS